MGEAKIVVDVIEGELLLQAILTLTQRAHPSADRRHMLPDGEVEAFHECRVDLPATGCQHLLHCLAGSEDYTMTDADKAPAPGRLDHLGIEQLRQRPPARLGREAFGLTAFRLRPVAEMGEQRDQIFLQPVCQKQWNATGCEYLHDLMDKALGHGPRARTNRDRQQQLALRVDRRPDPMRRARQTVDRLIFAHLPVLHGAEHGIQLIKLYLLYMHPT